MGSESITVMTGKKRRSSGGGNRRGGSLRRNDREEEVTEYDKQRQERIKENQKKLEELGLNILSSSLRCKSRETSEDVDGKKREQEDEEYLPSDHESSDDSEEDEGNRNGERRSKGKRKNQNLEENARRKLFPETLSMVMERVDEDDALQKAISLSLGEPVNNSEVLQHSPSSSCPNGSQNDTSRRKDKATVSIGRGKRKKEIAKRVRIPEDEAVAYFFSIDEAGKGGISLRDLQKMAIAHDFNWSDKEMAEMIGFFDTDGDGRLNFEDFRNILSRCHMIQEPLNS